MNERRGPRSASAFDKKAAAASGCLNCGTAFSEAAVIAASFGAAQRVGLWAVMIFTLLPKKTERQQHGRIDQYSGKNDEGKVALHLIARRRESFDEQVPREIARGNQREIAERLARFLPAADEKCNTQRNKKCQ